jgi:predicted DCC family thiol-disulfide oxidoreductase YuxK
MTRAQKQTPDAAGPVLLFDGVCNLCDATVRFIADRDPQRRFRFAFLQSDAGGAMLERHGLKGDELTSVVLLQGGQAFRKSTAMLQIMRQLPAPWRWLAVLLLLPRPLRDWMYDVIGRRRYRWFGRKPVCDVSRDDLRQRLIDD